MHFFRTTQHDCEDDNEQQRGTQPCRSPCSTSNQSEQTPSSGCTQALVPSWNCWTAAIISGGTPMRVSTCYRRARSTVSYAFWRSMKHMKRDTPSFRPVFCSLRTTNIMSMVERGHKVEKPHPERRMYKYSLLTKRKRQWYKNTRKKRHLPRNKTKENKRTQTVSC